MSQQPLLLLLLCLWPVFGGKLKQLGRWLLVQGLGEMVSGKRYFEPFIEYGPLPLQPDASGPFDKVSG